MEYTKFDYDNTTTNVLVLFSLFNNHLCGFNIKNYIFNFSIVYY